MKAAAINTRSISTSPITAYNRTLFAINANKLLLCYCGLCPRLFICEQVCIFVVTFSLLWSRVENINFECDFRVMGYVQGFVIRPLFSFSQPFFNCTFKLFFLSIYIWILISVVYSVNYPYSNYPQCFRFVIRSP